MPPPKPATRTETDTFGPIEVPGGVSIMLMVDRRQVLTADPRDALLSLKQISLDFPAGTTEAQAMALTSAKATSSRRSRPSMSSSTSSALARTGVVARRTATSDPARTSPIVMFELPMSIASSIGRMIRADRGDPDEIGAGTHAAADVTPRVTPSERALATS